MPIGLGLAASHAPNVFIAPEDWETRYQSAIEDVPQPLQVQQETPEVCAQYGERIENAFELLSDKLSEYKPDALIMVSDDHSEMFDEDLCNPNIAMFLGKRGVGVNNLLKRETLDDEGADKVTVHCHEELSEFIAEGLVERDFDLTVSRQEESLSPCGRNIGMGHGFTRTAPKVMPELDIPVVLIWLNCYYDPMPTAKRCLDLGKTLSEILDKRSERIAIFGTGGLSHDPRGPRAGWIDEPLDRSVLKALKEGDPYKLESLFKLKSDTYHGGTGEIRCWLTAGAAMGNTPATIVDYMAIHRVITGVGFAYWEPED